MCIGVLYGTAYWPLGDSKDKSGTFRIVITCKKQFMIEKIVRSGLSDLQIMPTDIISLFNNAWEVSFGRVCTNKISISERGWFPYKINSLLNTDIQSSMALRDIDKVKKTKTMTSIITLNKKATSCEDHQVVRTINLSKLQFISKTTSASFVLGDIFHKEERLVARKKMQFFKKREL